MHTKTPYLKFISVLTLLFFLHACTSVHTLKKVSKERIKEIHLDNIIVIHQGDFVFKLDKITLSDGNLRGYVKNHELSKDQEILYRELHLHLKADVKNDFKYNELISIPIQEIIKVEIYEHDMKKATTNLVLGFSSLIAFFLCLFGVVLLATVIHPLPE